MKHPLIWVKIFIPTTDTLENTRLIRKIIELLGKRLLEALFKDKTF